MNIDYKYPFEIELGYIEDEVNDEDVVKAGKIIINTNHILEAYPENSLCQAKLIGTVAEINKRDTLYVRVPPPKDSVNQRAVYNRIVKRGDEDFAFAVVYNLEEIYGFIVLNDKL